MRFQEGDYLDERPLAHLRVGVKEVDERRVRRGKRAIASRREAEVRSVFDDRQSIAVTLAQKLDAPVARAIVRDDDARKLRVGPHLGEREDRIECDRDLVLVVPADDDDVDY